MMRREEGFVLMCVLWVVAMLTVITLGFGHRAALDRRAAAYSLDHAVAMAAARGAVERGIVELANRGVKRMLLPETMRGGTHLGEAWANPKNIYEEGNLTKDESLKNDEASYIITDEERYINVNTAPKELLEGIKSMDRSLVRQIWTRRTKEEHAGEGIIPFSSVEELRYMRGVDDDDWLGTAKKTGLKDLLTVWGGWGINVNTASKEVLLCVPGAQEGDIDTILGYRAGPDGKTNTADDRGFMSMEDLSVKTGVQGATRDALNTYCTCESAFFKITGLATRRAGRIRAVCSAMVVFRDGTASVEDWQEKALGS
jgi:type II secretory pathway component PulK